MGGQGISTLYFYFDNETRHDVLFWSLLLKGEVSWGLVFLYELVYLRWLSILFMLIQVVY